MRHYFHNPHTPSQHSNLSPTDCSRTTCCPQVSSLNRSRHMQNGTTPHPASSRFFTRVVVLVLAGDGDSSTGWHVATHPSGLAALSFDDVAVTTSRLFRPRPRPYEGNFPSGVIYSQGLRGSALFVSILRAFRYHNKRCFALRSVLAE